jgi:chromosome segregation ATPase
MPEDSINTGEQLLRRFERDFQQTRDDVIGLKQNYTTLQSDVSDIRQSVRELVGRFDESKKTNWPFIGALIAIVPIIYVMMNSFTSNAVSPLLNDYTGLKSDYLNLSSVVRDLNQNQGVQDRDISNLRQQASENVAAVKSLTDTSAFLSQRSASSTEADVNSRTDRGQLNERVAKLEAQLAQEEGDRRSNIAAIRTHLGEVETQFHAVGDVANLRAAQQQRTDALLWQKAFGQQYPDSTFNPPPMFEVPDAGSEQ